MLKGVKPFFGFIFPLVACLSQQPEPEHHIHEGIHLCAS